jgi:transcriptional regulator with XRE-family HTH domain
MKKNISAIKFKLWCKDNGYSAQDIADVLHLQKGTVYGYWAGTFTVPDENKKKLEQELGLPIYEIFFDSELR